VTIASVLRAVMLVAALPLAACAVKRTTTMYDWGDYQDSVYRMYVKPGEFDPAAEVHRLETQVQDTLAHDRKVPPGLYAYLAMLCASAGDGPGAAGYFRAEKAAFPESAVFVDGMLARMSK